MEIYYFLYYNIVTCRSKAANIISLDIIILLFSFVTDRIILLIQITN